MREVDAAELDFWSFVALANRRLAEDYGFKHPLATEALLTLNRASDLVTYDLEAAVHRPRGRSWSAFRLLFVVWLAGPLESKSAARLTGMSRAAVSNLTKVLVADGLLHRTPDERDGRPDRLPLGRGDGRRARFRPHEQRHGGNNGQRDTRASRGTQKEHTTSGINYRRQKAQGKSTRQRVSLFCLLPYAFCLSLNSPRALRA